jgi:RNA polymerase sigma factor (sigma-70 family)
LAELAVEVGGLGDRDDDLVVETVRRHAPALLRTARRHSLCTDDAHDAYQRALEIFLRRAATLRRESVVPWLHTVVKHEAMAVREARMRMVAAEEVDLDEHERTAAPTPDERVVAFDRTARAAEALGRLKPHEVTALWLRAQGLSYQEIAERQSWTYTKVNRCLSEGRKAFLERYAGIESGEECRRWAPVVSALVDGEVTARQRREVRVHLRNCAGCRTTMRELRAAGPSLAGVLPVPLAAAGSGAALDRVGGVFARVYDAVAGGVHERAAASVVKLQAAAEAASTGKMAAVAASAAAIATGGAIGAQHAGLAPSHPAAAHAPVHATRSPHGSRRMIAAREHTHVVVPRSAAGKQTTPLRALALRPSRAPRRAATARTTAHEFGFEPSPRRTPMATTSASPPPAPHTPTRATSNASPEFGFEGG